ncbi:hypothetical protein [Halonatronum saccharophilum]|uniref:hypothetical protein n=1 Tax=Halonatronum saccharophilum TaxID=150060 RepID=UPI000483D2B8|nr:hypothetical protein [Halonatronum saccharophilum]
MDWEVKSTNIIDRLKDLNLKRNISENKDIMRFEKQDKSIKETIGLKDEIKISEESKKMEKIGRVFDVCYLDERGDIDFERIERSLESRLSMREISFGEEYVRRINNQDFIDDFVYRSRLLEDKFEFVFDGDEKETMLNQFEQVVDGVSNTLIREMTSEIEDFFNGNSPYIYSRDNYEKYVTDKEQGEAFNTEDFKITLEELIDQRINVLDEIINENQEEWDRRLRQTDVFRGRSLETLNFNELLKDTVNEESSQYTKLEDMSNDILQNVMIITKELNQELARFSNSSSLAMNEEVLGMNLGLSYAKLDVMVSELNLSDQVGEELRSGLDRNIDNKIKQFEDMNRDKINNALEMTKKLSKKENYELESFFAETKLYLEKSYDNFSKTIVKGGFVLEIPELFIEIQIDSTINGIESRWNKFKDDYYN